MVSFLEDKCSLKPCFPFVECENTPGEGLGFKCGECPPGYSGDGIRCDDVNEVNKLYRGLFVCLFVLFCFSQVFCLFVCLFFKLRHAKKRSATFF